MIKFEMFYTVRGILTNFRAIVEANSVSEAESKLKKDVSSQNHPRTNKPFRVREIFLTIQQ